MNQWSSERFQARLHRDAIRNGLGTPANNTLYYLAIEGDTRPSDLADWLGTGRANVSKVVNRLVSLGLAERREDASDGRAQLVGLTEGGWQVSREIFEVGDRMFRELIVGIGRDDLAVASRVIEQIAAQAEAFEARLVEQETQRLREETA